VSASAASSNVDCGALYERKRREHLALVERPCAFGDESRIVGDGSARASVTATPFELLRAISGRRSHEQIGALTWSGDADAFVARLSVYGYPDVDLVE
jgi:hypothetical protein